MIDDQMTQDVDEVRIIVKNVAELQENHGTGNLQDNSEIPKCLNTRTNANPSAVRVKSSIVFFDPGLEIESLK